MMGKLLFDSKSFSWLMSYNKSYKCVVWLMSKNKIGLVFVNVLQHDVNLRSSSKKLLQPWFSYFNYKNLWDLPLKSLPHYASYGRRSKVICRKCQKVAQMAKNPQKSQTTNLYSYYASYGRGHKLVQKSQKVPKSSQKGRKWRFFGKLSHNLKYITIVRTTNLFSIMHHMAVVLLRVARLTGAHWRRTWQRALWAHV